MLKKRQRHFVWKSFDHVSHSLSTLVLCIYRFHFSPQEVVKFCSDCVLGGEEEDTCDIPDAFYDMDGLMP
jgi:hypothetical protein